MKRPVIIAAVVALVALVIYFFYLRPIQYTGPKFPAYFPKGMITDAYVINLEALNDVSKLENESHRADISYRSQRTLEDNIKSFNEYFKAGNFVVEKNLPKIGNASYIGARKDKTLVSIALWKESPVRVSILYIVLK